MPNRAVVVGGGILGTQHAWRAIQRGWSVVQLEREPGPRGASVRNFGLVWVSGRAAGAEVALALRARELWAEVAADCPGTGFRPAGSLTIATAADEVGALELAADMPDARERGFGVLTREEALERVPALGPDVRGALWCARDAIVEPGDVLGAVRTRLLRSGRYKWVPGRAVHAVAGGHAVDHTGARWEGDLIIVCPGATYTGVAAEALAGLPLKRIRLQMLETEPWPTRLEPGLADIDSLRFYPAFEGAPRDALGPQDPVAKAWGAQLLLVQRAGTGGLTIGDTHHSEEPFRVDYDIEPERHLLSSAARVLGHRPEVRRRWNGVYSQLDASKTGDIYARVEPEPGVVVVTGPAGRGMTLSPAIAEETFA